MRNPASLKAANGMAVSGLHQSCGKDGSGTGTSSSYRLGHDRSRPSRTRPLGYSWLLIFSHHEVLSKRGSISLILAGLRRVSWVTPKTTLRPYVEATPATESSNEALPQVDLTKHSYSHSVIGWRTWPRRIQPQRMRLPSSVSLRT